MRISQMPPISGQQPMKTGDNQSRQMSREKVGRQLMDRYVSVPLSRPTLNGQSTLWDLLAPQKEDKQEKDPLLEAAEAARLCAKIAARVRAGDRVPMKDLRYLLKTDPDLYLMAMIMRQEKEDPKKWETLLKDRQEARDSGDTAETGEAPATPAACSEGAVCGETSFGESASEETSPQG